METQIKKRIDWIDIAKGIAIICTIVGHTVDFGGNVRNIIFSFHMPLFFILAGYTIKEIPFNKLGQATVKDFKRLIIPVFIIKVIELLWQIILNHAVPKSIIKTVGLSILWGNGCNYRNMPGIGAVWFLLTLFYSKILFRISLNLIKKYRYMFFCILAFLFCAIGKKIWLPQNFDLLFPAMLFMYSGYLFRTEIDESITIVKIIGIFSFIFWTYMSWNNGIYIELATRQYPLSMVSILIALCGALCVIQFCKAIENLKICKPLIFAGKYSLDLLCIHQIDYVLLFLWNSIGFFPTSKLNPYMYTMFRVIINIVTLTAWVVLKEKICKQIVWKIRNKA